VDLPKYALQTARCRRSTATYEKTFAALAAARIGPSLLSSSVCPEHGDLRSSLYDFVSGFIS